MPKLITSKSQIPKYAQKSIQNFKSLTINQAIYQYELLKLKRRAGRDYGSYLSGYLQMPSRVTKSVIQSITSLRGKKLESARSDYEAEQRMNRAIRRQEKSYETDDLLEPFDWVDSPTKPIEKSYDTVKEYLDSTGSLIDPYTGEVIDANKIANYDDRLKEYVDELIDFTKQYADSAVISRSAYRSGRTKTARSRQWAEDNINRATNKIVNRLEQIKNNESELRSFGRACSNPDYLTLLQNAIGDYISGSYSDTTGDSYLASDVYDLLSFSPMSFDDAMDFEYEE